MKSSNIGGQAVLEGIMMKHNEEYAVAVRKPDGEISVKKEKYHSIVKWKVLTTTPFIRGVFNFIDSMVIGIKTLTYSASFYEEEEEKEEVLAEEAVKADFYQSTSGEYNVRCQVIERGAPLIDLTIAVPSQGEAETIANNWAKKNQEVYAAIMASLL